MGVCNFRTARTSEGGERKRTYRKPISVGTDIDKRKRDDCMIDPEGKVLKKGSTLTPQEAAKTAGTMVRKQVDCEGSCRAACETTSSMRNSTYDDLEGADIPTSLQTRSRRP